MEEIARLVGDDHASGVRPETDLREVANFDSIAIVQLLTWAELRYGVSLADEDAAILATRSVDSLADHIIGRLSPYPETVGAPRDTSSSSTAMSPIVCCIDERYALPLCVLLQSLAETHSDCLGQLRVFVFHTGLTNRTGDRIASHAERLGLRLEFRRVEDPDDRYPVTGPTPGQFTSAVYLRLTIGEQLPAVNRALYLDVDLIIRSDLRPLLFHEMEGLALGAVVDPIQPDLEHGYALPGWRQLGVPGDRQYFNSGVMLLDLDRCRQDKVFERAHHFLVESPERAACLDQDALNWVMNDDWLRLDNRWNTLAVSTYFGPDRYSEAEPWLGLEELVRQESTAAVLHFAGPHKPWQDDCPGEDSLLAYRRLLDTVLGDESS